LMAEHTTHSNTKDLVSLRETIQALPDAPGVYVMRDGRRRPLYIGKALSLRKRVASYFQDSATLTPRLRSMVSQIRNIDFILTNSELEAFILESNLVKEQKPRYNIILRDDKHYPFIRIDRKEPFPRLAVARRIKGDGALYFGPYVPSSAMWDTLALIHKAFPLRKCKKVRPSPRPCLEYHMGRCLGPCTGGVSQEEYAVLIDQAKALLEGKRRDLLRQLRNLMKEAAARLDFERAAKIRDQATSLKRALEKQRVISSGRENLDVFGLAFRGEAASIQGFTFREGRLLGRESFLFRSTEEGEKEILLGSFLQQYYSRNRSIPQTIVLPFPIPEEGLVREWLKGKSGKQVRILVPSRGKKLRLLQMALANAGQVLPGSLSSTADQEEGARGLQMALGLPGPIRTLEAYDISNISGTLAVGSMIAWEDGDWRKDHYRRFKIKTVLGANDYGMMEEVLRRRLQHREEVPLPDLILLDGGKGQLHAGLQALKAYGVSDAAILALAKEEEEIWLPGKQAPLRLPPDSPALHLLQRVRDEAHRFALSYHRLLRRKRGIHSALDGIPGIGEKRKKALLKRFGNVARLKEASLEELQEVPGISAVLAELIRTSLGFQRAFVRPEDQVAARGRSR
jgi:excinuclease ABC subunit C